MKFVDEVKINVAAGDGGRGASHFRREKFVPKGGPDGGDGGDGGSVIVQATDSKRTLLDFRYRPQWAAERGGAGGTNRKTGKTGENVVLQVPVGTEVYRLSEDGEPTFVVDLTEHEQTHCIAKGGRGGKGNAFFKSATQQAPQHAQSGTPGEEGEFQLSLKLLADVGFVGLPNAGKSTLLSHISAARPEVADYPFTTKEPQLGIVKLAGNNTCVAADIPGLIEGAHLGKGLGLQFLKHIERTRVLLHLVDSSPLLMGEEGVEQVIGEIQTIEAELKEFSAEVFEKPRLLVFNKRDIFPEDFDLEGTVQHVLSRLESTKKPLIISGASGAEIEELLTQISLTLSK